MRRVSAFLVVAFAAAPCLAISPFIDNLDTKPHHLQIDPIGDQVYTLTIQPGERRELFDHEPTILNLDDPQARPIRTDQDEEYVFWKDGRLQLQKYNFRLRGGQY